MLNDILSELCASAPADTLSHYTSLAGVLGIVKSKTIWVSESRYLNDADEIAHLGRYIHTEIGSRLAREDNMILRQLQEWISDCYLTGPFLFTASFTAQGNLLSQWRGYCAHGKGVSLGFDPALLAKCAARQQFLLAPCVYESKRKQQVARRIVDAFVNTASQDGPADKSQAHPSQSYHPAFRKLHQPLMQIAAFMKNPNFREEAEWRVVSAAYSNFVEPPIKYREGSTMLIPYMEMDLPIDEQGMLKLVRAIIGPTPNTNGSMESFSRFIRKFASCPDVQPSLAPIRAV